MASVKNERGYGYERKHNPHCADIRRRPIELQPDAVLKHVALLRADRDRAGRGHERIDEIDADGLGKIVEIIERLIDTSS